jgi:hypothetical protein
MSEKEQEYQKYWMAACFLITTQSKLPTGIKRDYYSNTLTGVEQLASDLRNIDKTTLGKIMEASRTYRAELAAKAMEPPKPTKQK